jgi:hypothetical protein
MGKVEGATSVSHTETLGVAAYAPTLFRPEQHPGRRGSPALSGWPAPPPHRRSHRSDSKGAGIKTESSHGSIDEAETQAWRTTGAASESLPVE